MRIFIEPTEPLLFRTGRPFNAGEDNFADSIFPPTPETLQGALRAAIAVHWGQSRTPAMTNLSEIFQQYELKELIGDYNTYGRLRIAGLTLGRYCKQSKQVERLFPPPAHITRVTLENEKRLVFLKPKQDQTKITNISDGCSLLYPELDGQKTTEKSEDLKDWLTPRGLQVVLRGEIPSEGHLVKADEIYTREPRLGIGMNNNTKTTREGYLYQVQMIRMKQDQDFIYGFVIDLKFGHQGNGNKELPVDEIPEGAKDKLSFLQVGGWLTLGGEQRAAHFRVLKPEEIVEERDLKQHSGNNLLYFATPAYFKDGWLPKIPSTLPLKPITAAINRYQSIGGWALKPGSAGGESKLARRCIPAGSIYFFDQSINVTKPVTEYGWQIGYGITFTGLWRRS